MTDNRRQPPTTALLVVLKAARRVLAQKRAYQGEGEQNTYGLPEGQPIAKELREWLKRQKAAILGAIPDDTLPEGFPDLTEDDWTDPMKQAMVPLLGVYWDEAGKATYERLGLDPDDWRVMNPHLERQIEAQALAFCQSTNESTSKRLDVALRDLRHQLTIGLVEEGESVRELTARVKTVFEHLSTSHARMIAATEASRAYHAAELTADRESEVVAGLELLLSSDACPLCRKIATECKRVRLGEAFATIGDNPHYKDVRHPPLHPHCQCSLVEVLKPQYGGPENPDWGTTLIQPQLGLGPDYKPPPGKTEPKPEPDRPKPVPTRPSPKAPPPPEQAAIDQAAAFGKAKHVKVDPAAHDLMAKAYEPRELANIPAIYRAADQTIRINERCGYWKYPARWMEVANRKQPPWFSSSNADHIIVHEVGHAKHREAVGADRYDEIRAKQDFGPVQKALIAQHVSRYAATKPVEFVAEMYAGLAAGKHYNHEVTQLYLSLGGPIP